jgi:hypothetical protein
VGAFCTGLCAGLEREAALAFASHAAALTVSRMGAQPSLPTLEKVQTLLRERGCRSVDPAALDPSGGVDNAAPFRLQSTAEYGIIPPVPSNRLI